MRRRNFIALIGGAAAWPLAVRAQSSGQTPRVSVLLGLAEKDQETKSRVRAFQLGMRDLGWIEGRNVVIDYRYAAGDPGQIDRYVKELIALTPNVIVGNSTPVLAALKKATSSIPIVFSVVNDPCSEASCHSSGWKSRQQRSPVAVVVISSNGEGDRSVESLEVKVPDGWRSIPV